jgi:hypothetical protein
MSPLVKLTLGMEEVLNSNPAGAFRMRVRPEPDEMSLFFDSSMIIGPRVVHAPEPPVAAVSAEMAVPPEAPVTTTEAET